jgi:hypothetical protein
MRAGLHGTKTLNETVMKKIIAFIILSVAMVSCYEDYILDHTFTGIYFVYQQNVRTFVVGEGMKIEVGAALGGVRENDLNRNVTFTLDNSLLTPTLLVKMQTAPQPYIKNATAGVAALLPMPSNYYTLSNTSQMMIKAGNHMGSITVKPDSTAFLNDSLNTIKATYALPFYITQADADSIIEPKRSAVVGLMFENKLFGNYWHGGAAVVTRPGLADTTIRYKTTIPMPETKIWVLKTAGPQTLTTNGYLDQTTSKTELKLVLKGNNVIVSAAPGSTFAYTPDGVSTFNNARLLQERKIFLKYKYTNPGNGYTYSCTDTLTFRNRIRDGINEWYDENPSHYGK